MYGKFICFIYFVLILYLASNTQADLVGQWQFEGNLNDISGNGNDATAQGDAVIDNDPERGLIAVLDGSGDYLEIPHSNSLNITSDQITLTSWVYFDDVSGGPEIVLAKIVQEGQHSAPYFAYNLCILSNGTPRFFLTTSGTQRRLPGSPDFVSGRWYHMAGTYDGSEMILYVDGEVSATMNATGDINGYDTPLFLGINGARGEPMAGKIDDVRIYDNALEQVDIQALMLQVGGGYPYAMAMNPEDGAIHEDTWINISWRPGDYAVSHDIYIGDNFDDVNTGAEHTFQGNQTDEFIVAGFPGFPFPDGLVPGTTYYWRIDEVNETEPNSPWKGPVWSFSIPPKTAYFPDPTDGAESVNLNVELSWTPGFGAKLHTVYFGETLEEVDNATGGSPQGTANFNPGTLKMAGTYYWRVDEFDIFETHKGDIWSFTTEGGVANPRPAKGAVDVTQTPVLTWTPGLGVTHEIYFGTDASALEKKADDSLGSESYEPGQLEWNTTYYWRVDEANSANSDSPWTGPLWSFTTANFLIIDDFESYNDLEPPDPASNRIWNTWIDGWEDPTNGSIVGNDIILTEQVIVHSGYQAMPYEYNDSGLTKYSEATANINDIGITQDWTIKGVEVLSLWFRGARENDPETMYVALSNANGPTAVVYHDNSDVTLINKWTQWNIPLQVFADEGVDLTSINAISIGFGNKNNPQPGGTGMMHFDDIRLYPSAP
jgi:hypothetical protein